MLARQKPLLGPRLIDLKASDIYEVIVIVIVETLEIRSDLLVRIIRTKPNQRSRWNII